MGVRRAGLCVWVCGCVGVWVCGCVGVCGGGGLGGADAEWIKLMQSAAAAAAGCT
jgi:hypothetical protein